METKTQVDPQQAEDLKNTLEAYFEASNYHHFLRYGDTGDDQKCDGTIPYNDIHQGSGDRSDIPSSIQPLINAEGMKDILKVTEEGVTFQAKTDKERTYMRRVVEDLHYKLGFEITPWLLGSGAGPYTMQPNEASLAKLKAETARLQKKNEFSRPFTNALNEYLEAKHWSGIFPEHTKVEEANQQFCKIAFASNGGIKELAQHLAKKFGLKAKTVGSEFFTYETPLSDEEAAKLLEAVRQETAQLKGHNPGPANDTLGTALEAAIQTRINYGVNEYQPLTLHNGMLLFDGDKAPMMKFLEKYGIEYEVFSQKALLKDEDSWRGKIAIDTRQPGLEAKLSKIRIFLGKEELTETHEKRENELAKKIRLGDLGTLPAKTAEQLVTEFNDKIAEAHQAMKAAKPENAVTGVEPGGKKRVTLGHADTEELRQQGSDKAQDGIDAALL